MSLNEKNFLIVDTDEAGQVIGMRRMESGDTISNDRLNTDIRDAGSNATLALETANDASLSANQAVTDAAAAQSTANDVAASTVNLSSYIATNQGAWAAGGGLDATTLTNIVNASNAIADFSGASGTFASSNKGAGVIVDADIADDAALSGGKIATETITNTQIATNANINGTKLLANSVSNTQLKSGAAVANIGPNGITSNELGPSAVTAGKISANVITDLEIATGANIDGTKLAGLSVTNDELAEGVALENIGPGGIPSTALSAGAAVANIGAEGITSNELAPSAVTAAKINANAITADKIVDNTITATQIATNAITTDELGPSAVQAGNVNKNAITADNIVAGAAVANIGAGGITSNELGSSSVTAAKINANAITADKIVDGTITTTELDPNAGITNSQLAGGITNGKLAGSISLGKLAVTAVDSMIGTDNTGQPKIITASVARDNMGLSGLATKDKVDTADIEDNAVGTDQILNDSIQTAKIKSLNITNEKLAGEIPQHKLASSGISKINITGTSGVFMSGSQGGDAAPVPGNGAVMVIDTTAGRLKFTDTISGAKLDDGTIDDTKLAAGAAQGNIGINELTFAQLPAINAESFVGNNNSMGGNMKQFTAAQAKTLLDIGGSYSVGTTAPTSPTGGDLWYNTTDDELYTYDSGRGHWLGAPHYISMGKTTSTAPGVGHYLYVGHAGTTATTQERGWLVPHDMVITGWRAHTKSTFTGWTFRIDKNSGGTNTTGIVTTGALGAVDTFSDFTLDVDVAAGDILGVPGVTGTSTIDNSTMIIKIQRKGA